MIQNFDVKGGPQLGREHLPKLRTQMKLQGLDGFLIPHEDEYQNEYLPACNERLMWASGFTGSAGSAAVIREKAAVFVDGRYTLQVAAQVDPELFEYRRVENGGEAAWLRANISQGDVIGYDPRLHTPSALKRLAAAIIKAGGTVRATKNNPIDCLLYTSPSPRDGLLSRMPSSA